VQSTTEQLLLNLNSITEDLQFYGDGDYGFRTHVWEGNLNTFKIFESIGYLVEIDRVSMPVEEFNDPQKLLLSDQWGTIESVHKPSILYGKSLQLDIVQENLQSLTQTMLSQLENVQVFQFGVSRQDWRGSDSLRILTGCLANGDYVALSLLPDSVDFAFFGARISLEEYRPKEESLQFLQEIEPILMALRQSDAPVQVCVERSLDRVLEYLLISSDAITTTHFEGGFGQNRNYEEDEDIDPEGDYRNLDQFIHVNLENVRAYTVRASGAFRYIYVVGQTKDGDYLGVSTCVDWH
jgi:hypothetical protein